MNLQGTSVGRYGLIPGQWVSFELPYERGPYKVIDRDDRFVFGYICRCHLMNDKGDLLIYHPRKKILGKEQLPKSFAVKILHKEGVAEALKEKWEELKEKAIVHLKDLVREESFQTGFDPDDEAKELNRDQLLAKYGLTKIIRMRAKTF